MADPKRGYETRSGPHHARWNEGKMIASNGYVKVRVGRDHPLADPNGYAYEHLLVWVSAGNPRPPKGWLIHHKNEIKTDNRLSNFELKEKDRHGIDHYSKLSDQDVFDIRTAYAEYRGDTTSLGEKYGVPSNRVWKIIRGLCRKKAGGPIQTGHLRGNATRDAKAADPRPEIRT
jgi:HNH endonuclease